MKREEQQEAKIKYHFTIGHDCQPHHLDNHTYNENSRWMGGHAVRLYFLPVVFLDAIVSKQLFCNSQFWAKTTGFSLACHFCCLFF